MKRCGACGRPYRAKGCKAIVKGEMRIVCPDCDAKAIRIVQTDATCSCGQSATTCAGCVGKKVEAAKVAFDPKKIAKHLRNLAKLVDTDTKDPELDFIAAGRVEGLDQAVAYIDSGRWAS